MRYKLLFLNNLTQPPYPYKIGGLPHVRQHLADLYPTMNFENAQEETLKMDYTQSMPVNVGPEKKQGEHAESNEMNMMTM